MKPSSVKGGKARPAKHRPDNRQGARTKADAEEADLAQGLLQRFPANVTARQIAVLLDRASRVTTGLVDPSFDTAAFLANPYLKDPWQRQTAAEEIAHAFRQDDAASVRRLLRTEAGKSWARMPVGHEGQNQLMLAAYGGKAHMVEALLEVDQGALAGQASASGFTALLIAARAGHLDVLKILLRFDHGRLALQATPEGSNALLLAAEQGWNHCVKYLLVWNGGRLATSLSKDGDTALILAARHGGENVVRTMIDHGDKDILDHHNKKNGNALTVAAVNGHAAVVRMLLEARRKLAWTANNDMTPLLLAAQAGHADVVRAFLESPDGNMLAKCVASDRKLNALDLAEQNGHEEAAKVLREFDGGSLVRKPGQ